MIMKFKTENESIEFFTQKLESKGWQVNRPKDQYSYYDLEAQKDGEVVRFELKRRNHNSYRYNDTIMEEYKLCNFYKDGYTGYLVTFFDDCWTLSDVYTPVDHIQRQARHTTDFDDQNIVNKQFVKYHFDKIFKYEE